MSHLNISFSDFADSKYRVGPGYPHKETHLKLQILARAVLSALNLKIVDLTAIQAGQVLKKPNAMPTNRARNTHARIIKAMPNTTIS